MTTEKNFESMVLEFKREINKLQSPPTKTLTDQEVELLQEDKRLRSRSASFRLLGECLWPLHEVSPNCLSDDYR